jgi:hypothetical protein
MLCLRLQLLAWQTDKGGRVDAKMSHGGGQADVASIVLCCGFCLWAPNLVYCMRVLGFWFFHLAPSPTPNCRSVITLCNATYKRHFPACTSPVYSNTFSSSLQS